MTAGDTAARSTSIRLRPASTDDTAAIADVYLASFHATYDFPLAHTDAQVRAWLGDVVVPAGNTWVAVDDAAGAAEDVAGAVVGMVVVADGDLDQLYVAPDRLGQGIGRRLLDLAMERSPGGLSLYTFQVNDRARRFYERNGFAADWFGDGSANEEGQPDVRYVWRPAQ